jgi:hypothetical protein
MRTVILSLAAVAAVAATPALANEARVEARAGVFWIGGGANYTEATAGAALGYDFDIGSNAFAGVEVSGDKILEGSANRVVFGFTGRLGVKASANDKLFVAGGYSTKPAAGAVDSEHLGAGWEHNFGPLYGKVEYRHYFTNQGAPDANAVVAGLGINF